MDKPILRGEIYYANLDPVIGSEQGGLRPVLIIQNDIGNRYSPTVIIAPITSNNVKTYLPTHCVISAQRGLNYESIVMTEQIRTIDKRRLQSHIGIFNKEDISKVNKALAISIELNNETLVYP